MNTKRLLESGRKILKFTNELIEAQNELEHLMDEFGNEKCFKLIRANEELSELRASINIAARRLGINN